MLKHISCFLQKDRKMNSRQTLSSTYASLLTPHGPTQSFWPSKWWWVGLLVLLALASWFRFTGYDYSLPYIDHSNEPSHAIAGQMIVDLNTAKPVGEQGYPPGIVTLDYFLLRWFHSPNESFTTIIGPVRLIAIVFSLATIVFIALLGYRFGSPLAGLLAAFLWSIEPHIIQMAGWATP